MPEKLSSRLADVLDNGIATIILVIGLTLLTMTYLFCAVVFMEDDGDKI